MKKKHGETKRIVLKMSKLTTLVNEGKLKVAVTGVIRTDISLDSAETIRKHGETLSKAQIKVYLEGKHLSFVNKMRKKALLRALLPSNSAISKSFHG